jgi:hypothetical protein
MLNYGIMFRSDGSQYKWNSHSLGAFDKCPRYYQYSVIEGWDYNDRSVHLIFGAHYANALEHYYHLTADGATREEAIRETVRFALTETWDHERKIPNTTHVDGSPVPGARIPGTGTPWTSDHIKDRFTLLRSIIWYFEEFRDDLPVLWFDGKPAVEWKFAFDIDDGNLLVGTMDRVISYAGSPWIMDQKTSGAQLNSRFFSGFNPHTQVSQYTFVGRAIFDQPIPGVIIDATQVAAGFNRYAREPIYRTPSQLNEWYDGAMETTEAANKAIRENRFKMNAESCGNYGGCQYRGICSKSPETRRNFLHGDFTQTRPEREPE